MHGTVNLPWVVNNSESVLRCFQQQLIHHSLSVVARSGHPAHTNPLYARQCVAALRCNPTLDTSGSRLYVNPAGKMRLVCRRPQWRCCGLCKHTIWSKNSAFVQAPPILYQSAQTKLSEKGNETQGPSIEFQQTNTAHTHTHILHTIHKLSIAVDFAHSKTKSFFCSSQFFVISQIKLRPPWRHHQFCIVLSSAHKANWTSPTDLRTLANWLPVHHRVDTDSLHSDNFVSFQSACCAGRLQAR